MATISMDLVKQLREKTQVGMMDCKKALEETGGDLEKAVELLRKKGAAVAAKRAGNATDNGRVEAYVSQDSRSGALVQIACETDFSANTDAMKEFTISVAKEAAAENIVDTEALFGKKPELKATHEEILAKIAEKIVVQKIDAYSVDGHGIVNYYIHPGSRVGIMIELSTENDCSAHVDELKALARDICMHSAVRNPLGITPEDLDPALVAKEREIMEDQLKASGKPENMIDKIMNGKMQKFYKEVCLLHQPFIKNEDLSIQNLVDECADKIKNKITLKRFAHFVVGQ